MPPPLKRKHDGSVPADPKRPKISSAVPSSAKSSSKIRSNQTKKSFKRFLTGPYQVLISNQRHTNPVYPKPELKIFDVDFLGNTPPTNTPFSITNVGFIRVMNLIPTGTGVGNFTGNQISVKSASYRYRLFVNGLPTSGRVILIWDKQPNGAFPSYTDIFQSNTYLSYGNVNTRERFIILRNDQYSLSPEGDQTLFFERYVPINMKSTYANGSAGTVPLTGALLMAFIGDISSPAFNQPTVSGNLRLRYHDN